jgi:hypothetical protein
MPEPPVEVELVPAVAVEPPPPLDEPPVAGGMFMLFSRVPEHAEKRKRPARTTPDLKAGKGPFTRYFIGGLPKRARTRLVGECVVPATARRRQTAKTTQ